MMYTLYWIKSSEYVDPFSEGYVGITSKNIEKRFMDHRSNNKNKHLKYRVCSNTSSIVKLYSGLTQDEAKELEYIFRPEINIGWNINIGGDLPPSRKGQKSSGKSLLKGEQRTAKQKLGTLVRSIKIKGNNFSGMRQHKVDYTRNCVACGKIYNPGYRKKSLYCSRKCAGMTNKTSEKRQKLSAATKAFYERNIRNV